MHKNKCIQCGLCCFLWGGDTLSATGEDIRRWRKEKRYDILEKSSIYHYEDFDTADLWIDKNGEEYVICPWLKKKNGKYICKIQDTKPDVCREFYCSQKESLNNLPEKFKKLKFTKTKMYKEAHEMFPDIAC